jgi:DNA-binding GntR family transcriptional regulator
MTARPDDAYRDDQPEPVLPLGDAANGNTTATFGQDGLSEAEGALPPASPLVRESLSKQLTARLRDDIVHGIIPAGTHLVQTALCERFGVSRMPVRDALNQLAHEGLLIEKSGQRVVARLDQADVLDVYNLICVLNSYAARRAGELSTDEEIEALKPLFRHVIEASEPLELSQLVAALHRQLNRLARSPSLVRTLASLQKAVPRVFPVSILEDMNSTKESYQAIFAAIQRRDGQAVEDLTRVTTLQFNRHLADTWGQIPT